MKTKAPKKAGIPNNIGFRVSAVEYTSLREQIAHAGYDNMTVFLREAAEEKLNRVAAADDISRVAIKQNQKTLQTIDDRLELLTELVSFFVTTFFITSPPPHEADRGIAESQAAVRKAQFLRGFREHLEGSAPRLYANLLIDLVASQDGKK